MPPIELNDLDRRIWEVELDEFVPARVLDAHTHIYRWDFHTDPNKENGPYAQFVGNRFRHVGWQMLEDCDELLMPGRQVHRLSFPFPFAAPCDFDAANAFIADEMRGHAASAALMLVQPSMSANHVAQTARQHGFLGLKPYRIYSSTGDAVHCRITDFLPEHQIEVANELGLLVMLHLSKPDGIADPVNLADLQRLTRLYPRVRWILAHCARSYSAWMIERGRGPLRDLPHTWFDTSSVCESDAVEALLSAVGIERVMYGSDDVPVGVLRGKYVAFGYGWAFLSETNHSLNLSHCDPRMTFTRYEQLRAMRRATLRLGLGRLQIERLFHDNARQLIDGVRAQMGHD
jgi:glutamate-1-semialdehyde 2,1-aminomutase